MSGPGHGSPPPGRGRSASEASRAGVSLFNRTAAKTKAARWLRRNSSDVELRLWQRLRRGQIDGHAFRRQHPAGPYVLDFYCPKLALAIELDGGQHNDAAMIVRDARRTAWLKERGVTVLRFWNIDVMQNPSGVLQRIKETAEQLKRRDATPTRRWRAGLPLSGGGNEPRGTA